MKQFKLPSAVVEFLTSPNVIQCVCFLIFSILLTTVIGFQNFFFQKVVENGISRKDVIADKTITVIDTKRTNARKREVAQMVDPVLTRTEDDFIKNNLASLETAIFKIREKDVSTETKIEEIGLLFDISNDYTKRFIVNYFIKADEKNLKDLFDKSKLTLMNILNEGVSEKDYEKHQITRMVQHNTPTNTSKTQITIMSALLEQVVVPNLVIDELATEVAKKSAQNTVVPYEVEFEKGEKILFEGEPVTKLKRDALRQAGYNIIELNFKGIFGLLFVISFASFIFLFYIRSFEKKNIDSNQLLIVGLLSIIVSIIPTVLPTGFSPYIIPFPAYIIILAILTNPRVAFVCATLLISILTLGIHYNIQFIVSFTLLNMFSSIVVARINFSRRFNLIKAGFYIAVAGVFITSGISILEKFLIDINNIMILRDATFTFANGIISSMIALGILPLLEGMFKIITPYGLAELADHNQPVLKRLQLEAPGTYHHSLMVANLCEAAAEAVGGNPVLARVGAFYHDIGKLKRPLFFVENQSYFGIENPHSKLNSRLSKIIITAHTKDGVELAKEYHLPSIIHNFILQHHGEGLASYFYNQAVAEEGKENVKEEQFRYSGPKPNSKEAAILMIADAVESAVRAMKSSTPEEIEAIIDKIIVERINDNQLADSPLTLKDLKTIAATFSRILRGVQHNRIKYHDNFVQELDKSKVILPNNFIDKELDEKIKKLEGQNNGEDKTSND